MPEIKNGEVEGVISFVIGRAKSLQQRDFVIMMNEIDPLMIGAKTQGDKLNRIRWIMEDLLIAAGIKPLFQGNGYKFSVDDSIDITQNGEIHTTPLVEEKDITDHPAVVHSEWTTPFIPPHWYSTVFGQVRKGRYPALIGPKGCGKSRTAEEIMLRLGLFTIRIAMGEVRDPVDLIGTKELVEENGVTITRFVGGMLTQAIQEGWGVILDEFDSVMPNVALTFNKLFEEGSKAVIFTEKGVEVLPKHPSFRMIVTANTWGFGDDTGNYIGTRSQNRAAWDRFRPKQNCGYDPAIEKQLVRPYLPEAVIQGLYGQGDPSETGLVIKIRQAIDDEQNAMDDELGFRSILYFAQEYREMGWHKGMWYFMNEFRPENRAIVHKIITDRFSHEFAPSQNDHSPDQADYIPNLIPKLTEKGFTL